MIQTGHVHSVFTSIFLERLENWSNQSLPVPTTGSTILAGLLGGREVLELLITHRNTFSNAPV